MLAALYAEADLGDSHRFGGRLGSTQDGRGSKGAGGDRCSGPATGVDEFASGNGIGVVGR